MIQICDLYDSKMQFCASRSRQILFRHDQLGCQTTEKANSLVESHPYHLALILNLAQNP
jgi:hypothetical protein